MNTKTRRNLTILAVLIFAGVAGRFLFLSVPNFKPTAAVALFAGFYFARRQLALLVPVMVLMISNFWLGAYTSWGEMIVVYSAFLFPALLGRHLLHDRRDQRFAAARWGTCMVAPSLVFFLTTNFAVWLFNGVYSHSVAGLVECYVLAVPFYGFSLAGDLVFVPVVFGAYQLARAVAGAEVFAERRGLVELGA